MSGSLKILYYGILRFGGAMYGLLFALFMLGIFGIRDFWKQKKSLLWCAAAVPGTFVWRIMWLGSLNGRSTRYYVFTAVIAIFLLPFGIQGAIRVGKWCHFDRLPLKAIHWWSLLVIAVLVCHLGPELCPKDNKNFLRNVSQDIAHFCGNNNGRILLFDGTKESFRMTLPANVITFYTGQIRLEKNPHSADYFLNLPELKRCCDEPMLLFFRQPKDHSSEHKLQNYLHLEKISEYPFRNNIYSLYHIKKFISGESR